MTLAVVFTLILLAVGLSAACARYAEKQDCRTDEANLKLLDELVARHVNGTNSRLEIEWLIRIIRENPDTSPERASHLDRISAFVATKNSNMK
jgi:hypothetical protein